MNATREIKPDQCADSTIVLSASNSGERLDKYLSEHCPQLSRSRLQQLIRDKHITVDGKPARPSLRLKAGQRVRITVPEPQPGDLKPQNLELKIVYEDENLLVVDKPAGMTVHPAPGHPDQTLANAVLALRPDIEGIGGEIRPGIVHRLDKDTSGLLIVAKNERAHNDLSRQFKERKVHKCYLALVHGTPDPPEAIIEASIGRHPKDRQRMALVESGRDARTEYRLIEKLGRFALIEAYPLTGRTHQIRVHLAAIGHPVAGDRTYGKAQKGLERQFLHAQRLTFHLPFSEKIIDVRSELPDDLQTFLDKLRRGVANRSGGGDTGDTMIEFSRRKSS